MGKLRRFVSKISSQLFTQNPFSKEPLVKLGQKLSWRRLIWAIALVITSLSLIALVSRDTVGSPPALSQLTGSPTITIDVSPYILNGTLSKLDYEDRPANIPIDTIVLHHTALSRSMPVGNVARSWQNSNAEVSAHFVIGSQGEILMTVPVAKTAFHILKQAAYRDPDTGVPINWINIRAIGFEFHYDPRRERPTRQQIIAGGRLIGALFNVYPDLDVDRIIGHGVQAFSNGGRASRILSEPTYLFLNPNGTVHPNLYTLLTAAAEVSPEIEGAIAEAGSVQQLANRVRQNTIAGKQTTLGLDARWTRPSGMPITTPAPEDVYDEVQQIIDASRSTSVSGARGMLATFIYRFTGR
ncbi:MAG: peptidoglycan recognition family protein [Cyanobacteria bacterium P01_C01_bin.89]